MHATCQCAKCKKESAALDRFTERLLGPKERADLALAKRVCKWCKRGNDWDDRWEYVNGRRWYHKVCIDLMDMVS